MPGNVTMSSENQCEGGPQDRRHDDGAAQIVSAWAIAPLRHRLRASDFACEP